MGGWRKDEWVKRRRGWLHLNLGEKKQMSGRVDEEFGEEQFGELLSRREEC